KTYSLPRATTGTVRTPSSRSSSIASGRAETLIDSNSTPRFARNSFTLTQLEQPGRQYTRSSFIACSSHLLPPCQGGREPKANGGLVFGKTKNPRSQKPLAFPLDRGAAWKAAHGATLTPRTPCFSIARATKPERFTSWANSRRYFA